MDDGSLTLASNSIHLHTQGFDLSDNQLLQDVLKEKFNIIANVHKDRNYYRLYITAESVSLFVSLVQPYILPCFEYKLLKYIE